MLLLACPVTHLVPQTPLKWSLSTAEYSPKEGRKKWAVTRLNKYREWRARKADSFISAEAVMHMKSSSEWVFV